MVRLVGVLTRRTTAVTPGVAGRDELEGYLGAVTGGSCDSAEGDASLPQSAATGWKVQYGSECVTGGRMWLGGNEVRDSLLRQ